MYLSDQEREEISNRLASLGYSKLDIDLIFEIDVDDYLKEDANVNVNLFKMKYADFEGEYREEAIKEISRIAPTINNKFLCGGYLYGFNCKLKEFNILEYACVNRNLEMLDLLLDFKELDVNKYHSGYTPIELVMKGNHNSKNVENMVKKLKERGAK